jgi:hypothetical protein
VDIMPTNEDFFDRLESCTMGELQRIGPELIAQRPEEIDETIFRKNQEKARMAASGEDRQASGRRVHARERRQGAQAHAGQGERRESQGRVRQPVLRDTGNRAEPPRGFRLDDEIRHRQKPIPGLAKEDTYGD